MSIRRNHLILFGLAAFLLMAACTPRGGGRGGGRGSGGDDDDAGDDDDSAAFDDDDATDDDDAFDDDDATDDDDASDDDDATGGGLYEGNVTGEIIFDGALYSCVGTGSGFFENGVMSADLECNDEENGVVCSAGFTGLSSGASVEATYDCYTLVAGMATMQQSGDNFVVTTQLVDESADFEYQMTATLSPQ